MSKAKMANFLIDHHVKVNFIDKGDLIDFREIRRETPGCFSTWMKGGLKQHIKIKENYKADDENLHSFKI